MRSLTGALAGAYYGYSAITAKWQIALKDEDCIHQTALNLGRTASRSDPTIEGESLSRNEIIHDGSGKRIAGVHFAPPPPPHL